MSSNMDKKRNMLGNVTFAGNVTFNGPMFDIHDNEKVIINSNKPQENDCSATQGYACQSKNDNENEKVLTKPKATGGGRPKKSGTRISKAFIYNNKVDGSVRLRMLCQGLMALGWLTAETDMQVFVDLFSGGETRQRLIWKGDANALAALFKRLVNERELVTLPDKHSLWVMVCGHFWDKKRGQEFEPDKLRNTHAPKENDQTIAYLVNILDPKMSMEEIMEMIQNQR